jgi:hypothetical protein
MTCPEEETLISFIAAAFAAIAGVFRVLELLPICPTGMVARTGRGLARRTAEGCTIPIAIRGIVVVTARS